MRMDEEQFLGQTCHDPAFSRGSNGQRRLEVGGIEFPGATELRVPSRNLSFIYS